MVSSHCMPTTPAERAGYQRTRYRRKRQSGLCARCQNPTVKGKSLCESHRAERNAYLAQRYAAMRAALIAQLNAQER